MVLNLIYICNHYGLSEVSSYWQKVIDINNWQMERISNLIVEKLFGTIAGKKIGILGFSFKENTNDTRESPAIKICKDLIEEGANLHIFDPKVELKQISKDLGLDNSFSEAAYSEDGQWYYSESVIEAANDADALVIVTNWDIFKNLDWQEISKVMRKPSCVFDTRSVVNKVELRKYGIKVWSLGIGV